MSTTTDRSRYANAKEEFQDKLDLHCPADAIRAMIEGLKKAAHDWRFAVDMHTFGRAGIIRCYGCAATCALQEAAGRRFSHSSISYALYRAQFLDVSAYELRLFETSIDYFRQGRPGRLFDFFDQPVPNIPIDWYLRNNNWESELPRVELYLSKLIEEQS
jgi:hypothetical protein